MLALKIIGGILLFLLLLLLCPVRLEIAFREEFFLTLRYLFLKIPLVPSKEKPGESEAEEEERGEKEEAGESTLDKLKEIVKRNGFSGFVKSLFQLVGLVAASAKRLISHLKWKTFDLYLCVGGAQDAGAAAIQYGELSAGVYSATGLLFSRMSCNKKGVTVDLDYDLPENTVDFSARLSLLPIFAVRELFSLLIHGVPILWKLLRAGKGRQSQHKGPPNSAQRKGKTHE